MAATQRFQLVVEAQARGDAELARLSATVNKLGDELARANKKMADDAVKNQVRYSDAMKRMNQDSESSLGGASKATSDGSAGLGRYATAALGVYAAVNTAAAGFDAFVRGAGEAALEIKSLSLSTGLTINQADKLRAAANLTGFDIRNLKEAALDLSVALKDTGGQGDQTRQLLKQLGVSAYTSTGQTRQLNDVLLETFDALSKVQDTTQRVNLSRVLGGEDAAKNVQPLLAGYREANQLAEQLGFGTREGLLKALDDSNKQLRAFDLQWEIIKGKLAEKIAPVIVPILLRVSRLAAGDTSALPGSAFSKGAQNAENEVLAKMFPTLDGGAALSRLAPSVPGLDTGGLTAGAAMSDRFRRGQLGGEDGIKARLEQLGKERAGIASSLASGSLSKSAFELQSKELSRITAEQLALNKQIEFLQKARAGAELVVNSSDLINANIGAGITVGRVPSLRGRATSLPDLPEFVSTQADRNAFDSSNPGADKAATSAELQRQKDQRERELNTSFARSFVQFQERKIEMLTGPGGELAAIQEIYDLKKAGLQQELDYGTEVFDLTQRRLQIEQERTLAILNLQRQRRDEARGLASDFVGSLQDGNPAGFLKQQGSRLLNQVGTNALTGTFQRVQGTLGRIGAASGLGGLLQGTLLDPANATPIDKNTLATDRNTAAIERQATGGFQVSGPNGFNAMRALGPASGFLGDLIGAPGVFSGASASNPMVFSAAPKSTVTPAPGFIGLGTTEGGAVVPLGGGMSKTARGVGIAGAVAGGAIGAYTQFKAGGAQGALNGSAAIAGAAASIIALSGATGPAAPILAGVALGLQGIAMILGDPKKKRDAQINQRLTDAYYDEADPISYSMDRLGRSYDTNKLGGLREITVNISALDSRSIVDSRESIADALRMAIYEGHGINRAMQEAVGAA